MQRIPGFSGWKRLLIRCCRVVKMAHGAILTDRVPTLINACGTTKTPKRNHTCCPVFAGGVKIYATFILYWELFPRKATAHPWPMWGVGEN